MGLLDVTFSSDLLPEPVKTRRAIICAKASDPAHIPKVSGIFNKILSRYQYSGPMCTEIVQIMNGWGDNRGNDARLVATICRTITRVQQRNDSWFILASNELGVQEPVLRDYAAHGNSLSLAILIHITRKQFSHVGGGPWLSYEFWVVLEEASNFNVQDTSPKLQHEFCALWNQIVRKVQKDNDRRMEFFVLSSIRNVYIALHQETDSAPIGRPLWDPSSYPLCDVAAHHPDSTPHIHNASISTCSARVADLVPTSIASPETSSSMLVPPFDNLHPWTTTENLSIPITSPDPVTTDAFVPSGLIMSHLTSTTSTPAPPLSSSPPSTDVALQHNADFLALSDPPIHRPLAPSNPFLDNALSTAARLSSHPSMIRSDRSPSFPESHRSSMVITAPRNPPRPTFAHDLGAGTEDNGIPKPRSLTENDALDPPSANHANTTPLDRLPRSLSLPLVAHSDVASAGPSLRGPYAERTGDYPSPFTPV
ncbi:hypothetical protein EDB87DRAFT_1632570 [Lactarius vividus]|nr:hypothetical protein EDB87DRAFT_1632570 [Lactarius vividus]